MAEENPAALHRPPADDLAAIDFAPLLAWDCDLVIPDSEYDRMAAHSGLDQGLRLQSQSTLTAADADPTLLGIFKDGGRYVCAMWAIYLHACGELSLQGLKALCAKSGLLSPGRARAVLLYMRYLGYIEPSRERKSPTIYMPTRRFYTAWTTHMRLVLEATCAIEPAARAVVDRIDDPAVFASIVRTQGESLFNGSQQHETDTPLFKVFINRHAGTLVLSKLVLSQIAGADGAYPPATVTLPAATELARRFQVSRIQIRRLFTDAAQQNLVHAEASGQYRLDDGFRAMVRKLHAMQLRHLMLSVARAARLLSATAAEQI